MVFLFVFFFWDSYDSNGALNIVREVSEVVLISFNYFFFFSLCFIYFYHSIFYLTYPIFCLHYSTVDSLQSVFDLIYCIIHWSFFFFLIKCLWAFSYIIQCDSINLKVEFCMMNIITDILCLYSNRLQPRSSDLAYQRGIKMFSWVRIRLNIVAFHPLNSIFSSLWDNIWRLLINWKQTWLTIKTGQNLSFVGEHYWAVKPQTNFYHYFKRWLESTYKNECHIKKSIIAYRFWYCYFDYSKKLSLWIKNNSFLFKSSFNMCLGNWRLKTCYFSLKKDRCLDNI